MIPRFVESGVLPPGVHSATLEEVRSRFGESSELRRVQMQSVEWMIDLARQAGVSKIVLNGSFVTDILEPNDVDCVLLIDDMYLPESVGAKALEEGLPFLEMKLVPRMVFDQYVEDIFGTDRLGRPKGTVEVII
jgi:hypothetical protein